MPKYEINFEVTIDIEVTADTVEDAYERAEAMLDYANKIQLPGHIRIGGVLDSGFYREINSA